MTDRAGSRHGICGDGMCWQVPLCEVIDELKAEVERLTEYRALYEDACKLLRRWQYNDTLDDRGEVDATADFLAGVYERQRQGRV